MAGAFALRSAQAAKVGHVFQREGEAHLHRVYLVCFVGLCVVGVLTARHPEPIICLVKLPLESTLRHSASQLPYSHNHTTARRGQHTSMVLLLASTLLAAPGIELLAKDGRGETALDHAVGERQWAVAHLIADALDAAGALDAAPAVAAQVAQLREGAKAAAPAAELTPAERVRRNQEILAARKASRESN